MKCTINGVALTGVASSLPARIVEVADMGKEFSDADMSRIISSSGVKRVHIAGDETCASDLCVHAAKHLLDKMAIEPSAIDALVFITQTPDYKLPATSAVMQDRLSLRKDITAFDINYGCSGYIYGLLQAGMLISSGMAEKVLLCLGDTLSKFINPKDRSTRVLMGDAGAAVLVEKGAGSMPFHVYTNGGGVKYLCIPAGAQRMPYCMGTCREEVDGNGNTRAPNDFYMDGMEVMHFALKHVPDSVKEALAEAELTKQDIDTFLFHQPNRLILEYLQKKLKIPRESLPILLENTGNTGPVSIPLALCLSWDQLAKDNKLAKVLSSGFGSGLTVASVIADLSKTLVLPPVIYEQGCEIG